MQPMAKINKTRTSNSIQKIKSQILQKSSNKNSFGL